MTYGKAGAKLSDPAGRERELPIGGRRTGATELASLTEAAHVLRSPKNAVRLLTRINRAFGRSGKLDIPASLRRDIGLEE